MNCSYEKCYIGENEENSTDYIFELDFVIYTKTECNTSHHSLEARVRNVYFHSKIA